MFGHFPRSYMFSEHTHTFCDIHIALARYSELPSRTLAQILSIRKSAFIDRRKWDIDSYTGSDYEYDEYDDDDALYIYSHIGPQVTGCVRLRPSYKPTLVCGALGLMLNESLSRPNLFECWEATRFALLNSDTTPHTFSKTRVDFRTAALLMAMLQFARTQEVSTYEVIVDALMEKVLRRCGWPVHRRTTAPGSKGEKIIYGTLGCTSQIYENMLTINHMHCVTDVELPLFELPTVDYSSTHSSPSKPFMTHFN